MELGVVVHHEYALALDGSIPHFLWEEYGTAQGDGFAPGVGTGIDIVHLYDGADAMNVHRYAIRVDVETQRVRVDVGDNRPVADFQFLEGGVEGGQFHPVVGGYGECSVIVEVDG